MKVRKQLAFVLQFAVHCQVRALKHAPFAPQVWIRHIRVCRSMGQPHTPRAPVGEPVRKSGRFEVSNDLGVVTEIVILGWVVHCQNRPKSAEKQYENSR